MQLALLPLTPNSPANNRTSTFVDNMTLPVHGWFRFSAGFSAAWVAEILRELKGKRQDVTLLDPFSGVATTPLAGEEAGVAAFGIEAQPFIARIAQAKLFWRESPHRFLDFTTTILNEASSASVPESPRPALLTKCYPRDVLDDLFRLRLAVSNHAGEGPLSELSWLALTSILRVCSPVGTAPWQYVLPNTKKARAIPPMEAFHAQISRMASDMRIRQMEDISTSAKVLLGDARDCQAIPTDSIDVVITSPPYANNYDYADATRLEMTFFGDVSDWGQLHTSVRKYLVRACSQHVSIERLDLEETLVSLEGTSIFPEIRHICTQLARERLSHGGKKAYHLMIAAYFSDLYRVWQALRRVCKNGSKVCFVIGDSAPYGVHVPVERCLGQLALDAGFRSFSFEKLRDRNVKWKNRKHRVPLHEGHLWVEG